MKNHALLVFLVVGMMLFTFGARAQEASSSPSEESTTEGEAKDEAKDETEGKTEEPATEPKQEGQEEEQKQPSDNEQTAEETEKSEAADTAKAPPAVEAVAPADAPKTPDAPKVAAAEMDKKDTTADSNKEESKEEEESKHPFADTEFYWENQFSAISLDKSHDYTYNPVYVMAFGLTPKWAFQKGFSLETALEFDTELTNSDFAAKRGEVFIKDIPFKANYKYSLDINDDVKFSPGAGLGLVIPVSKMSQFATLYTALTFKISLGFMFPNVLKGLMIGWSPSIKKYFHESQSPKPEKNILDESGISPAEQLTSETFQALAFTGGVNPSWSINNGILIALSITDELSFSFMYSHVYLYKYATTKKDMGSQTDPMGPDPIRDTGYNERGMYLNNFMYELSYVLPKPVNMFTPYIGAVTMTNQLNEDGSYHTPFFNRETLVTFGIRLNIDQTVQAFQALKAQ